MLIMVSGPYSAPSEAERQKNLETINRAAVQVVEKGHIPVVGINAALPIIEMGNFKNAYDVVMDISVALAEKCDAILTLGTSKGVEMEKQAFVNKGLPVFETLDQIP
jgi:hypothetical protein